MRAAYAPADLSDRQVVALHNLDSVQMSLRGGYLLNFRAGLITTTTSSRYTHTGNRYVIRTLTPEGERLRGATVERYAAIRAELAARYAEAK